MLNLPLWVALVILAALLACGEQTPDPRRSGGDCTSSLGNCNISART